MHFYGDDEKDEKSPAWASSRYPKKGHSCTKEVRYNPQHRDASTQNLRLLPQKCERYVRDKKNSSFEARGQGHSDLKQHATFHYPKMYPNLGFLCLII